MAWISGWILQTRAIGVSAYAITFAGCLLVWMSYRRRGLRGRLFLALAVVQFLLLLDMVFNWRWQLHEYAMEAAKVESVYGLRRSPQLLGLAVLAILFGICAAVVLLKLRYRRGAAIALMGTLMSMGMWASEAVSYHYLDLILYYRVAGVMLVSLIWVVLTAVTCCGLWIDHRSLRMP